MRIAKQAASGAAFLLALALVLLAGCSKGPSPQPGTLQAGATGISATGFDEGLPNTADGERVRRGREMFDHTPQLAGQYVGAKLSCSDCHIQSGTAAYAAPMVDLAGMFPMFNKRAGHVISLEDRIQECFTRSENGRPLPYDSEAMKAMSAYIHWLSRDEKKGRAWNGRGLVKIADLTGDAKLGSSLYQSQCSGCHGTDGAGVPPVLPPLWGPGSYNDGAGMNNPKKMAAFLVHNMPQNHPGTLSPQHAFDVAAYVHTKPRPHFNEAYKRY